MAGHQFTAHVFCKPLSYHNGSNKNLEFSVKALKSSSTSKLSVIIEWVARKGVKIRFSNSLIICSYKPSWRSGERILTEVAKTDRTQWGLYQRPRSRFSYTDRPSSVKKMFIIWPNKKTALKTSLEAAQRTQLVLSVERWQNFDKKRSSSLAGMFSVARDSFSDSGRTFLPRVQIALSLLLSVFWSLLLQKFLNFDFIFNRSFFGRTQIRKRLLIFFTRFLVEVYWFLHLVLWTGTSQFFHILCW